MVAGPHVQPDSVLMAIVIVIAGFFGGAVNAVVGSGTLITFPTLLAIGIPPVTANGTNTMGLSFGSFSSAFAYRAELRGRGRQLRVPMFATLIGAVLGATLVLALPARVFTFAIPWLIFLAAIMVAVGPRVTAWVRARKETHLHPVLLPIATGIIGIYGGYFGAGQGVMLMAVLGVLYDANLQHSNGAKNLLSAIANITAAIMFAITGHVIWLSALLIALGAVAGGYTGGRFARRIPQFWMRVVVVLVGIFASGYLLVRILAGWT